MIIPSKPNLISVKKMIAINYTSDDFKRHATAMDIVTVKKKKSTSVKLLQYCIPRENTRLLMTSIVASAAVTLLEEGPEKYSGSERDSNSRPLRCRCCALTAPNWAIKATRERSYAGQPFLSGRYTWPKYSKEWNEFCPLVAIEWLPSLMQVPP